MVQNVQSSGPETGHLCCLGAVCGDVIGSVYEFNSVKTKSFPLFPKGSHPTDDTMMTVANMLWLTDGGSDSLVECMRQLGASHPHAGYGGGFRRWLSSPRPEPYGSYGNGSAMRVSPVAWAARSLDEALSLARRSAEVTHNHPEGIKGAQATAAATFMALHGATKDAIRQYVETTFGYNLSVPLSDIRPGYRFEVSCQRSVPEALSCFLESDSYEDAVRNAVSLGGDADTQAAIAGAVAEAFYGGVPEAIVQSVWPLLPVDVQQIIIGFSSRFRPC